VNGAPLEFDRQIALSDMLTGVPKRALDGAMQQSVGPAWRILDVDGSVLREGPAALEGETASMALSVDLDPMGSVVVPVERQDWLAGAARWIELLLGAANRYRMAADLHLQAVHADHCELMAKHEALAVSEQRYRTLSAELEERVRAQVAVIEESQRRMYEAQKMASIGNLAAGMAHEINNPIGFMRSNLSTAKSYVNTLAKAFASQQWEPSRRAQLDELLQDFHALVDESIGGADRVARIVGDLKAFASSGNALREPLCLNDVVHAALRMLGELPGGIRLELDLQPLPACECDREGMHRLLLALLTNARTAMRGRSGVLRVTSAAHDDELVIAVADQGCGIDAATLPHIFDPFFTTHDVGAGMGLGLTVASDVARAHGGRITVDSVAGAGSTFTVCLPRAGGPAVSGGHR
jgi:signal transduction histidine kinase